MDTMPEETSAQSEDGEPAQPGEVPVDQICNGIAEVLEELGPEDSELDSEADGNDGAEEKLTCNGSSTPMLKALSLSREW